MENNTFSTKAKSIALVLGVVLFGITGILFGTAALIHSATPAQADTPASTYATGKYGMSITSVCNSDGAVIWYIIAWDTESGRSKLYYGTTGSKKTQAAYSSYQLPSSPL